MALQFAPLSPSHVEALAVLHRDCFDDPWGPAAFSELFETPGIFGFSASQSRTMVGFVLLREGGGEAEILTLAVDPSKRRTGIAKALVSAAILAARERECESLFLEVARDNEPAHKLYLACGFEQIGIRPNYYRGGAGKDPIDALVLRRGVA